MPTLETYPDDVLEIQTGSGGGSRRISDLTMQNGGDGDDSRMVAAGIAEIEEYLQDAAEKDLVPDPTWGKKPTETYRNLYEYAPGIGVVTVRGAETAMMRARQRSALGPMAVSRAARGSFGTLNRF
jgi:hypothetical protein